MDVNFHDLQSKIKLLGIMMQSQFSSSKVSSKPNFPVFITIENRTFTSKNSIHLHAG